MSPTEHRRERAVATVPTGDWAAKALVVSKWLMGVALVSWRYMWQITPLHRVEEVGDVSDLPPELPAELVDERCQLTADGVGPLFHRRFRVRIDSSPLDARELISSVASDLNHAVPSEVAAVERTRGHSSDLRVGDELIVRLPGPWNAPVRVTHRDPFSFRMTTLRGHLEAGQIEFRAGPEDLGGDEGAGAESVAAGGRVLRFEIEAWARPGSRLVHLLYTRVRLAKEMQLNMWVRFCLRAAVLADGQARGGVHIHTRRAAGPFG